MPDEQQRRMRFHYIKSGGCRAVHADGAVSGPTPKGGGLHIAFFSERNAIPQLVEHILKPDDTIGEEVRRVGKIGIVREIEIDVFLDTNTAKALIALLQFNVEKLESHVAQERGS